VNYVDRGIGTFLDAYTSDDLEKISKYFFEKNSTIGLRNRAMHLLCHSALTRGQGVRNMELPDIHFVELPAEGSTPCTVLIIISNHGKTNQFGKIEFYSCMRSKNVLVCPISALALYFFTWWHVDKEPFPNFSSPNEWYDLKVFCTKTANTGVSYTTHNEFISECFKTLGIISNRKTHSGRGSGVCHAEMSGCSEDSLRRLGNWNQSNAMDGCYLRSLPRQALRGMAGFPPDSTIYELERGAIVPSEDLQKQFFPEVDEWIVRQESGVDQKNLASIGFLKALKTMRLIILQDAVFLKQICAEHPIWCHDIFNSGMFFEFEQTLKNSLSRNNNIQNLSLRNIVPNIKSAIEESHGALSNRFSGVIESNRVLAESINKFKRDIEDIFSGRASIRLNIDRQSETNVHDHPTITPAVIPPSQSFPSTSAQHLNDIKFHMSRSLTSVSELWKEFHEGIAGNPSIQSLEERYGNTWRKSSSDSKFFSKRRLIIEKVLDIVQKEGVTTKEAIFKLDTFRGSKTLDWLSKNRNSYE
jgi:hypothetical protein